MTKTEAAEHVRAARIRATMTWAEIATALDKPLVWTTAALLGQHPVPGDAAATVGELLGLSEAVVEALQLQPSRTPDPAAAQDPTVYRFHEALAVYGPALKELIHEEFGDGIMSAINFKVDIGRRSDPDGDRVVVTFDGKFLDYRW
ncbi:MAG: cyanase [Rhodococcus sp. (in: high G+C Gram-positive bacteria)]